MTSCVNCLLSFITKNPDFLESFEIVSNRSAYARIQYSRFLYKYVLTCYQPKIFPHFPLRKFSVFDPLKSFVISNFLRRMYSKMSCILMNLLGFVLLCCRSKNVVQHETVRIHTINALRCKKKK